jgi:catechol-2,3-dioxygenase
MRDATSRTLLLGLDHADVRVRSLPAVEAFYDALLPPLGLSRKSESHVAADGEWYDVAATRPRNVIEYHTPLEAGSAGWFVGFIENPATIANETRIAFTLEREDSLAVVETLVREAGGLVIERSLDASYPALFFEDPAGTRLEICARRPRG